MGLKNVPYLKKNREYESNIQKYRVAMGYTVVDLCKEIKCTPSVFAALAYGIMSPYYESRNKKGQIKPYVQKMADIFKVPLDELFPRYICNIERYHMARSTILPEQAPGLFMSLGSERMSMNKSFSEDQDILKFVNEALKNLSPRCRKIFTERYTGYKSCEQIADEYECTRSNIHGILKKSMIRVRQFLKNNYGIEIETEIGEIE